ncbi:hypothetical protein GDO86_006107 [Hymenochirus boettgeri]|uniref:non-specific serine/threonine protein kinase n=1 Tax=Hymenochirus boettgeri TaxID=247094 RepID=A0A8T2J9P1_9PIPI|nr:hypothetical protein GDO86_006107 [Hymenochirus boettgeri]
MGTRRPMSRTPSTNGRFYDSLGSSNGSASESDESNGSTYSPRADSRSYLLNVRPENRTTFCNIISQLTEETQPSFETTLKARAVSEGCDAKFICMVSGYPEPEVTWYKDDEEMDRYCGLPKYEIFRNGNRHTLQIYKCGEEDAAIYQASARNSKGIVSCSGVLEVGTMTEYQIHQRWFAKLKRKAEAKMREIEQSRRQVKKNLEQEESLRKLSPERIQRKRRFSLEKKVEDTTSSIMGNEDLIKVDIPDPNSRLQEEVPSTTQQQNGVSGLLEIDKSLEKDVVTNGYAVPDKIEENGKEFLAYVYETVESITKKTNESYAKKKKKDDDPPSVSLAEAKREEASTAHSQKKEEGISPPPRRLRFYKDLSTSKVEEKMDTQTVPVTSNRRFVNNTAFPKLGKFVSKDTKKLKEAVGPTSKGTEGSCLKKDQEKNEETLNSDESMQVTQKENNLPAHGRDQKSNSEFLVSNNKHDANVLKKFGPRAKIIELPKAAPRRTREQRDSSFECKPTNVNTGKVLSEASSSENNRGQDVKPICDVLQHPQADPKPEPSSSVNSHSTFDIPGQCFKKIDTQEVVPFTNPPKSTLVCGPKEKSQNLELPVKETQDIEILPETITASEDPHEDTSRVETITKLKHLEIEYMALQKAYALLQQQLELSQKAEQEAIKAEEITECQENQVHKQIIPEQNDTKIERGTCNNKEEVTSLSSSVSELMETDSVKAEVDDVPQIEEGTGLENIKGETSPVLFQNNTEFMAEYSFKEDSCVKDVCLAKMEDVELEDNTQCFLTQKDKMDVENITDMFNIAKPKEVCRKVIEVEASLPIEIEMLEDVNQSVQLDEIKQDKLQDRKDYNEPFSDQTFPTSISEDPSKLKLVPATMETGITPFSTVLSCSETQTDIQETSSPENSLETSIPGASLAEFSLSSGTNQSVATLLRDVKATLESSIDKDVECLSEASSSSGLSPLGISSPEEYFVESSLSLPNQEEEIIVPIPFCTEANSIPVNVQELLPDVERSENIQDFSIPLEQQKNNEVQSDIIIIEESKQDQSLVTTLKNSLLMLFNIKPANDAVNKTETKERNKSKGIRIESPEEICSPEESLSPLNDREKFRSDKYIESPKSAESMHSSSTSGKLTPNSEEDTSQNADSLQTSPTSRRKVNEFLKTSLVQEGQSILPIPIISRGSNDLHEEILLTKNDLGFSPTMARKIEAKIAADSDFPSMIPVPSIVVGSLPAENTFENLLSDFKKENNRKWRSTENLSVIPAATPQELASGARRKIYLPKTKQLENAETGSTGSLTPPSKQESPCVSPGQARRNTSLLPSHSPPVAKRSPGTARKMTKLEVPKIYEEFSDNETTLGDLSLKAKELDVFAKEEVHPTEIKKVNDPFKAPQVIRKIRAEQFSDSSVNLKLWCQFFNILNDSVITWYKDEVQVAKVHRSSGDEGQVALAIVQASTKDCGVYQCTIENDFGTDSTDCLLSAEILSGFITKEEVEVGEEIEMTQMVFAKGLTDSGYWGDKFFGRIVMEDAHVGEGFLRKSCRMKAIYGLEPIFDSGKTCIIKIRNLIVFGTKNENSLVEKNYEITIQECKIQNTTREYCKIFAAECRAVPNFGQVPEILPLNLIYRPANNIPYATIEEDLEGRFQKFCIIDLAGKLHIKNSSDIEQKCCTFQHWVFQWTNGNVLVTALEGVRWKLTNIQIATKSKGYQGLKESCNPSVLEEFPLVHQCNQFCEMLGLKSLKATESLQPPSKLKGSKSPSMGRKATSAQSSPQIQKKALASPQSARKGGVSPKVTRKVTDTADSVLSDRNKGNHAKSP